MQECEKELDIVSDGAVQVYDENSFRFARDMLEKPLSEFCSKGQLNLDIKSSNGSAVDVGKEWFISLKETMKAPFRRNGAFIITVQKEGYSPKSKL